MSNILLRNGTENKNITLLPTCFTKCISFLYGHFEHNGLQTRTIAMYLSVVSYFIQCWIRAIYLTLLNRLYGVWPCDLFTCYFRFQNKCNRNKFEGISQWISGFYIKLIYKECHWTPFYQSITLRGREYHFPVVRMFLRAFSPKQWAETSVHKGKHPSLTKMTIVDLCFNVSLHIFAK